MHRRARHLTGRAAGASFHYDSRWLSLSDGSGVQTFTDVSGTNNATQATSTNQPTFKVNILNGNPVVRFDGTNDFMSLATGAAVNINYFGLALFKSNSTAAPTLVNKTSANGLPYTNFYFDTGTQKQIYGFRSSSLFFANGCDMTSFAISTSYSDSSSNKVFHNGIEKTTTTSAASGPATNVTDIGIRDQDNTKLNGDVASLIHITGALVANSLRKRFEQSVAFSFKLPCS